MQKRWKFLWICALLIVCLCTGCSSGSKNSTGMESSQGYDTYELCDSLEEDRSEAAASEETAAATKAVAEASHAETGTELQVADPNRKLVKYLNLELETKEFDSLNNWIQEHVQSSGGYIESSNVWGESSGRTAGRRSSYIIRIPVDGMDSFAAELEKEATVVYRSENVDDITLSYVDTESHISALRTEQETLLNMLSQSGDLDSLLAIQERLADIRYELENYESQLRLYENDVKYSTITVDVTEVEREKIVENGSFGSQLKEQLSANFHALINGLRAFVLWFLGALPFWILLAVVIAAAVFLAKRICRKKTKK